MDKPYKVWSDDTCWGKMVAAEVKAESPQQAAVGFGEMYLEFDDQAFTAGNETIEVVVELVHQEWRFFVSTETRVEVTARLKVLTLE